MAAIVNDRDLVLQAAVPRFFRPGIIMNDSDEYPWTNKATDTFDPVTVNLTKSVSTTVKNPAGGDAILYAVSGSGSHSVVGGTSIPLVSSSTIFKIGAYVKLDSGSNKVGLKLSVNSGGTLLKTATNSLVVDAGGSVGSGFSEISFGVQKMDNGWAKLSVTGTYTKSGSEPSVNYDILVLDSSGNESHSQAGSFYIYGPTLFLDEQPDEKIGDTWTHSTTKVTSPWNGHAWLTPESALGTKQGVVYLYRRSATALNDSHKPDDNVFNYTTNDFTAAPTNSWTRAIPTVNGDPVYVIASTPVDDNGDNLATVLTEDWADPVVLTKDGIKTAIAYLYTRTNTSTPVPSAEPTAAVTYTFGEGITAPATPGNSWSAAIPAPEDGRYLWQIQAVAFSSYDTDNIDTSEWSVPKILAQDGIVGADGEVVSIQTTAQVITVADNDTHTPSSVTLTLNRGESISGGTPTTGSYVWSVLSGTFTGSTATVNATTGAMTSINPQTHMGSDQVRFQCAYTHSETGTPYDGRTYIDTITLAKLRESATLTGILDNENHSLPANNDGVVQAYTGASGQFSVYYGTVNVTESCTFSLVSDYGFSVGQSPSAPSNTGGSRGQYTVTAGISASVTLSTATYRASYTHPIKGVLTVDKVFSIGKSIEGPAGEGIGCVSTSLITAVNDAGTYSPNSITLSVLRGSSIDGGSPTTGSYVWSVLTGTFTGATTTTNASTGAMTAFNPTTDMGSDQVQFQCEYTHNQVGSVYHNKVYYDRITITKVYEAAGISATLSNESHSVPKDGSGAVLSYVGAAGQMQVYYGSTDVTEDSTFTLQASTGFATAPAAPSNSPGTRGDYSVTSGITNSVDVATATYRAAYTPSGRPEVTIDKVFTIVKVEGASGAGATLAYRTVESVGLPSPASVGEPTGAPTAGNAPHLAESTAWYTLPPAGSLEPDLWLFQISGTFDGTTYTWDGPAYLATFKVGALEALSANMGTLTAGSIETDGYGIFAGNSTVSLYPPGTYFPAPVGTDYNISLLGNVNALGEVGDGEIGVYGLVGEASGQVGVAGWCENYTSGIGTYGRSKTGVEGVGDPAGTGTVVGVRGAVAGNSISASAEWGVHATNANTAANGITNGAMIAQGPVRIEGVLRLVPSGTLAPIVSSSTAVCTGLNADMIDGFHAPSPGNYYGVLVGTSEDGVTEAGGYIDMHAEDTDSTDYAVRLLLDGGGGAEGDGVLKVRQRSGTDDTDSYLTVLAGTSADIDTSVTAAITFNHAPVGAPGTELQWIKTLVDNKVAFIPYLVGNSIAALGGIAINMKGITEGLDNQAEMEYNSGYGRTMWDVEYPYDYESTTYPAFDSEPGYYLGKRFDIDDTLTVKTIEGAPIIVTAAGGAPSGIITSPSNYIWNQKIPPAADGDISGNVVTTFSFQIRYEDILALENAGELPIASSYYASTLLDIGGGGSDSRMVVRIINMSGDTSGNLFSLTLGIAWEGYSTTTYVVDDSVLGSAGWYEDFATGDHWYSFNFAFKRSTDGGETISILMGNGATSDEKHESGYVTIATFTSGGTPRLVLSDLYSITCAGEYYGGEFGSILIGRFYDFKMYTDSTRLANIP